MSFNLTGGNPRAHRIRVYYENTGLDTVVEGMPLCYNYDTTTNWWGGSMTLGAVTESTTTAETTANEGRYIRVENPSVSNLDHFAGVVAKGSPGMGKAVASAVDIYVPNGAVVPVRANIETTVGRTILSIQDGVLALGNPTTDIDDYGRDTIGTVVSRPIAIAMETDAALDTTAGTLLAKLCPEVFLFQGGMDAQELVVGYGNTTAVNLVVNKSLVDFKNTDGHSCALLYRTRLSGAGSGAALGVYRFDIMMDATSYGEPIRGVNVNLELGCSLSQTVGQHTYALSAGARSRVNDPDLSGAFVAVLNLETFMTGAAGGCEMADPPATHVMIRCNTDSTGSVPDYFLWANKAAIAYENNTTHTSAETSKYGAIKIFVQGTTLPTNIGYIYVYDHPGE